MKITFIYPSIGTPKKKKYLRTWTMEPLVIAILAGLTPTDVEIEFFDDRLSEIDFNTRTDLVAITVETYTSKRAYEISAKFKERGIPVIMGGYHPTLVPKETLNHCDSIVIGDAEGVWQQVVKDVKSGSLKNIYQSKLMGSQFGFPERKIFSGRNYLGVSLVETARGCKFTCEFCSISSFYDRKFHRRPIAEVTKEVRPLKKNVILFVDDNIIGDIASAKELFKALIPEKIKWISQCSINIAWDDELVDLMAKSGCVGVLIGFESINAENLAEMGKQQNFSREKYAEAISKLRKKGIVIYGTFVFGYDNDDQTIVEETVRFAIEEKLFIAAFNHLMPFPGTALYRRLVSEQRMINKEWWCDPNYKFGDVCFNPKKIGAKYLSEVCIKAKKIFYRSSSILKRGFDFKANCKNLKMASYYLFVNFLLKKEVTQRRKIRLGDW